MTGRLLVAHLFTLPVWNDTGSFFEGLGLPLKEKQGYVIPVLFRLLRYVRYWSAGSKNWGYSAGFRHG